MKLKIKIKWKWEYVRNIKDHLKPYVKIVKSKIKY